MIDYTGKLNNHEDYINILNKVETMCDYIEIVVIDGKESNDLVNKFKNDILKVKKVSKWWGTKIKDKNYLYKIKTSKSFFDYIKKYETFCKYYEYGSNKESFKKGDYSEITDFGLDDIAFYDNNNDCLLCTTTHEGYILIKKNIIKEMNI